MIVVIEMSAGTKFKYEMSEDYSSLWIDRVLPIPCPHNYGYVMGTLSEDGDAIDAFVVTEAPIEKLCRLNFEPHYLIQMQDNGVEDNKYVGCIKGDKPPTYENVNQIVGYLLTYKENVTIGPILRVPEGHGLHEGN